MGANIAPEAVEPRGPVVARAPMTSNIRLVTSSAVRVVVALAAATSGDASAAILANAFAHFPSALERVGSVIGERPGSLQLDIHVAVVGQDVGIIGGAGNAGGDPWPGLSEGVVTGLDSAPSANPR